MECARWNFDASDAALLVCKNEHEKGDGCDMQPMHPAEVLALVNSLRSDLLKLKVLIGSDSFAATFQSLGQYRSAILKELTHNTISTTPKD